MCGRYQRGGDKQRIAEAFNLGNVDGLAVDVPPDYNAAPGSMQPVIVWDEQFGARTLSMMFWKFLPPYVTDSQEGGRRHDSRPRRQTTEKPNVARIL